MLHFEAEFPENTDHKNLYELLKPYKLNVTEMIFITFVYGDVDIKDIEKVINICYAFDVSVLHICKRADS